MIDPPPPFSDSDLQWYEALDARPPQDFASPARQEALALRLALAQRRQSVQAAADAAAIGQAIEAAVAETAATPIVARCHVSW